ncbi:MAG TPA: hypothetical protein VGJ06_21945 [Candidatus Acidoferrum sp.]
MLRAAGRRSFLASLAGFGLARGAPAAEAKRDKKSQSKFRSGSETKAETVYRLLTPECEVQMSVEYFGRTSAENLRFRDRLSNRAFCLSTDGEQDKSCAQRFSGSIAIARYHFQSRLPSRTPVNLRERVLTIDRDARMGPRAPFERALAAERDVVSDIQAFGYDPNDPSRPQADAGPVPVWCLLRQDLYLNGQPNAFLIVHWKHTLDAISLVDVIPGDRTEVLSA